MTRLVDADKIVWSIPPEENIARCIVANAPTVDTPVWIPVKERMPIERQDCLVTVIVNPNAEPGFTWRLIEGATFIPEVFNIADYYELSSPINDGMSYGWVTYDDEDGCFYRLENVVAWIPLPKPYMEEEHETD